MQNPNFLVKTDLSRLLSNYAKTQNAQVPEHQIPAEIMNKVPSASTSSYSITQALPYTGASKSYAVLGTNGIADTSFSSNQKGTQYWTRQYQALHVDPALQTCPSLAPLTCPATTACPATTCPATSSSSSVTVGPIVPIITDDVCAVHGIGLWLDEKEAGTAINVIFALMIMHRLESSLRRLRSDLRSHDTLFSI